MSNATKSFDILASNDLSILHNSNKIMFKSISNILDMYFNKIFIISVCD